MKVLFKKSTVFAVLMLAATPVFAQLAGKRLTIGDKAPPLAIAEWARGEPADLSKTDGKQAFVIEFWATWCAPCLQSIPHLDKLQAKYKSKGLTVIGVTDEPPSTVKSFLAKRKDSMQYTVAVDQDAKTTADYLGGVGANGIPYTFIIDKQGQIAWHGHPADPSFDEVVDQVAEGKFDVETARTRAANAGKIAVLWDKAASTYSQGKFEDVLTTLQEILALDATHEGAMKNTLYVIQKDLKDSARLKGWVQSFIEKNSGQPKGLLALSAALMDVDPLGDRDPELIVKAARAAYDASPQRDAEVSALYALALYSTGQLDEAIRLQTEAVGAAEKDVQPSLQRTLEYFLACKSLKHGS